jgi:large subunit ribosomal protein L29
MKINAIQDLSGEELMQKERNLTDELFKLRFRHSTNQIDSTAMLKTIRRDIARIKTVLRERELRG